MMPDGDTESGVDFDRGLQSLADAASELATLSSQDLGTVMRVCARLLSTAFGPVFASVALMDDSSGLVMRSEANANAGIAGRPFSYGLTGSPCADVLVQGRLDLPAGALQRYPNCDWLRERQFDSYLGLPIQSEDHHAVGVVLVAGREAPGKRSMLEALLTVCTERIAAELAAAAIIDERLLAGAAFEFNPQGVMITDESHRIVKINPAFTRITGWSAVDVLGRRDSLLSAGRDDPGLRDEIRVALDAEESWIGERWSRRRDGEVFPEERTVVALPRRAGKPQCYLNMFSDISAEKFAAERIHRLAHYDATTELPNRVLLQDRLLHAINHAARAGGGLALLFLDLDGFKMINDSLGHQVGDEVLHQIGVRLRTRLRKADVIARLGGDEFAVVLTGITQDNDVQLICDQLLAVVSEPFELQGQSHRVSTSIGIALFPEDGTDVQTLLKHADAAMYQAKSAGKNRYAFYEPEINRRAEERLMLARQLRQALQKEEFTLCYQPQYDLVSGRLVAVEALLRWRDHAGEAVSPTRIIPVAEDSGLIAELGVWVLRSACRQAQAWRDQGLEFGRLSVNISGRQFQGEGLLEVVAAVLAETGFSADLLELEITETWVMEGPFKAEKQMAALTERGINFVIDDFGVANASMAYLKHFPVQKLKIDRSFVRDVPDDPEDAAIVSAIIAMGHSLGLRVVAEGVETAEQAAFLRGTGCDEVQGFLYGKPVAADEMNVMILYNPTFSTS